jgi:hypothetical protein
MPNSQEVNVDLVKDTLVNEDRTKATDIFVLIISAIIIRLDIRNWWKKSHQDGRS